MRHDSRAASKILGCCHVKVLAFFCFCCFSIWYWLPKGSMSTISYQKKCTLEALLQQYTAAKAKKLQD